MVKIKDITDKDVFFPRTHERAVVDDNGTTLETKLQMIGIPDGEDIVSNNGHLQFSDKAYSPINHSGLGHKILRKNIKTENVVTSVVREELELINPRGYKVDLNTHILDYTNARYQYNWHSRGIDIDVQAGDIFEINGGPLPEAFTPASYSDRISFKLWALVDPVTKQVMIDDNGNYLMSETFKNYEGHPFILTIPKDGHLCISCWDGAYSKGEFSAYKLIPTTESRELNIIDDSMLTEPNTIYHVKYDFDLNGKSISLPPNSILQFDGGSIKNSSSLYSRIVGNNSEIQAKNYQILPENVYLEGKWFNEEFYPEWFGAIGDGITDDTVALKTVLSIPNSVETPVQTVIKLNKSYLFTDTLVIYANTTIKGNWVGSHTENNLSRKTLIAALPSTRMLALTSYNISKRAYNESPGRIPVDNGSIKYCNSIRIERVWLHGNTVSIENEGSTINKYPFCGVKIAASINSSIRDTYITGFLYGVARFATWYASDSDLIIGAKKVGYLAGSDMNGFSIYNGYINATKSVGYELTSDDIFSSDGSLTSTAGVATSYARGSLLNVISEHAQYGRQFNSHSFITDINPWLEGDDSGFYINGGNNITIIRGYYNALSQFIKAVNSDTINLVGVTPNSVNEGLRPCEISIANNCNLNYQEVSAIEGQNIPGLPSGIGKYYKTDRQMSWWNATTQYWADANGFGLQKDWEGSYADRPVTPYMQPGAIYMKNEGNGITRPIFQMTEGTLAYVKITATNWAACSSGTITITIGGDSFSYNLNPANFSWQSDIVRDMIKRARVLGFRAETNGNNHFFLYSKKEGVINSNDITYDDGGTGLGTFTIEHNGTNPVFVDALGGNAENDKKVSTLPATATDGDILFYTVIGKPVYYSNGHWYDFGDNEVTNPVEE